MKGRLLENVSNIANRKKSLKLMLLYIFMSIFDSVHLTKLKIVKVIKIHYVRNIK